MAWYRKRVGGDLDFIRVVVKSKSHMAVKQERSPWVKGMCGDGLWYLPKLGTAVPKWYWLMGQCQLRKISYSHVTGLCPSLHPESCTLKTLLGQKNCSHDY